MSTWSLPPQPCPSCSWNVRVALEFSWTTKQAKSPFTTLQMGLTSTHSANCLLVFSGLTFSSVTWLLLSCHLWQKQSQEIGHRRLILTLPLTLEVTIPKILFPRNPPSVSMYWSGVEHVHMWSLNVCPHLGQHFSHCYGDFPIAFGGLLCHIIMLEMECVITLCPHGSSHFLDERLQMNGSCVKGIYTLIIISHSFHPKSSASEQLETAVLKLIENWAVSFSDQICVFPLQHSSAFSFPVSSFSLFLLCLGVFLFAPSLPLFLPPFFFFLHSTY